MIPISASTVVTDQKSLERMEKAWHAVNEIVESEQRYVQKLALLERFRNEVDRAHTLDRRQTALLFANITSL